MGAPLTVQWESSFPLAFPWLFRHRQLVQDHLPPFLAC